MGKVYVDLTHPFSAEIPRWPYFDKPEITNAHTMAKGGVEACAKIVANMFGSNGERAKDLAYRLYTIAERKNWANEAYAYNALVVSWPDIQARAAVLKEAVPEQLDLFTTGMLDK